MGLRFQRRLKIFPGVRLNFSKSGISTSIGTKGAWVTFGKKGTRTTIGIPGSGISYTEYQSQILSLNLFIPAMHCSNALCCDTSGIFLSSGTTFKRIEKDLPV